MNGFLLFFSQHPYIAASITTWISQYGVSAFITSLPSPTKDSSEFYKFCFKFLNTILAQNPHRGFKTSVESSPNFEDAVVKRNGNGNGNGGNNGQNH